MGTSYRLTIAFVGTTLTSGAFACPVAMQDSTLSVASPALTLSSGAFACPVGLVAATFVAPTPPPTWLVGAAVNQWVQISGTQPSTTSGLAPTPTPAGTGGAPMVVNAWGGGTLRPTGSEYYLHGGGHGDYAGNEIYMLRLSDDAPTWTRTWGPTANADISADVDYYADGNPGSSHTYYNLNWDDTNDRLLKTMSGRYITSGMFLKFDSWTRGAANWNAAGTHPDVPVSSNSGCGVARHPTTGNIYLWYNAARAIWQSSTNTWTFTDVFSAFQSYEAAVQVDPVRNCVWSIGGSNRASGVVWKWDIATNVLSAVTVTGGASSIALGNNGLAMCYVSTLDKFYIYTNAGAVYVFDPVALTIETLTTTGTAPGSNVSYGNGTAAWGRWQYASELGGFVYLPAWAAPTFFLKVE